MIEINVIKWDELSEEDKNKYNDFPDHNVWDYVGGEDVVMIMQQRNEKELLSMIEYILAPTFQLSINGLTLAAQQNNNVCIIIHCTVKDPAQVKKKIESILNLKCFW